MAIGIADHREVTDDSADVDRRLYKNVSLTRKIRDSIDFCPGFALKAKVIEAGFHLVLHNYQDKERIPAGRRLWSKPNVMSSFRPAVANNREAAERSVEID